MVSLVERRRAAEHGVSERRACQVIGIARSTKRRPSGWIEEAKLVRRGHELTDRYPRFGYQKIHAVLRSEGFAIGRDCEITDPAGHPAIICLDDGQGGPNDPPSTRNSSQEENSCVRGANRKHQKGLPLFRRCEINLLFSGGIDIGSSVTRARKAEGAALTITPTRRPMKSLKRSFQLDSAQSQLRPPPLMYRQEFRLGFHASSPPFSVDDQDYLNGGASPDLHQSGSNRY